MLLLKLTTENLADGIIFTIYGFAIVMLVLLLITFILYAFSWIINGAEKKKALADKANEVKEEKTVEPVIVAEPAPQAIDDTELVAVITAAIAASLNTTSDKLVVRSIKKVNSWKKESIRQKNKGLI